MTMPDNTALLAAYRRYRAKGYRPNTAWMLAMSTTGGTSTSTSTTA